MHTYSYVRGTFPAFVAEADLGEFNLGCANFSLRGQGWRWRLCMWGCVKEGKTKRKIFIVLSRLQERKKKGKVDKHVGPVGLYTPADRFSFNYAGFEISKPEIYERY